MKTLIIAAGANGSGKTTFAKKYSHRHGYPFVNADEIAKELCPENLESVKLQAGKAFFKTVESHMEKGDSFVLETTLSGKYLIRQIEKAKALGYQIKMYYIFLDDPKTNIWRVRIRVREGGHHVPHDDIVRRYHRSLKLFWNTYAALCDSWYLFYNGDLGFEEVARKSLEGVSVLDSDKYDLFQRKVQ